MAFWGVLLVYQGVTSRLLVGHPLLSGFLGALVVDRPLYSDWFVWCLGVLVVAKVLLSSF